VRLFSSLQSKLIVAFVAVVVVALGLAGSVFIVLRRDDQEERALDHVAASAPEVLGEYAGLIRRSRGDVSTEALDTFVHDAASQHDVRVLLVGPDGRITSDSGATLTGKTLTLPDAPAPRPQDGPGPLARGRNYVTWEPGSGTPGAGLVLVSSSLPTIQFPPGRTEAAADGRLVLAVSNSTITNAWLSLLPGLGVAALIALPVAVLLAILLARYITRPLQQLTVASRQMASGTFDIDVPTGRRDELGDLAEAFAAMAERVGSGHAQMRTLVANVSHDLKTPLTSILGFGRALHTGAVPSEDAARIGGIIEEEAERLSARLNDLLLLSELDAGKALVDESDIDLSALVRGVIERVLPDDGQRPFTQSLDLADGVIACADAGKLERAIENLLDNARKFTPPGGTVALRTYAEPGANRAVLTIANSCEPIADDELARLFDRFYRRDRTRSARTNGSGLGLAIARDLVRLQHGDLTAASDGEMLTLTLALPASHEDGAD
jgi:signal transduction histidine kinase